MYTYAPVIFGPQISGGPTQQGWVDWVKDGRVKTGPARHPARAGFHTRQPLNGMVVGAPTVLVGCSIHDPRLNEPG